MALAALMAARLADAFLLEVPLSGAARASRAAGARVWCSTLTLPAAARIPLARVVDSTEHGDQAHAAEMLTAFASVAGPLLDAAARAELADLASSLAAR